MTRQKPPLQPGETFIALQGSPLAGWNPESPPDTVSFVEWLRASLRLVRRHENGALEFVVVDATGEPPKAPLPPGTTSPLPQRLTDGLDIPPFLDRRIKAGAAP